MKDKKEDNTRFEESTLNLYNNMWKDVAYHYFKTRETIELKLRVSAKYQPEIKLILPILFDQLLKKLILIYSDDQEADLIKISEEFIEIVNKLLFFFNSGIL